MISDHWSLIRATHVLISWDCESFSWIFFLLWCEYEFNLLFNSLHCINNEHLDSLSLNICMFSIPIKHLKFINFSLGRCMRFSHFHTCSRYKWSRINFNEKKIVGFGCYLNWITENSVETHKKSRNELNVWCWSCPKRLLTWITEQSYENERERKKQEQQILEYSYLSPDCRIFCISNHIYAIDSLFFFLNFRPISNHCH